MIRDSVLVRRLRSSLFLHWEFVVLSLLFTAGFLLRLLPLLQYPHVGGDPFVHYSYAIALLDRKLSVAVPAGTSGSTVQLYYPPLFHLISLGFFLAFPTVDPYAIMKIIVTVADALQIVPIYLIVKRVSGSGIGGLVAAYCFIATRSDYQMLTWGGYANILALLFLGFLVYALLTDRFILSAVSSAAMGLTHHLTTLFAIAVLLPYFGILLWHRRIAKSVVGVLVGAGVAWFSFYQYAWQSIYYYYTNFSPVYNQSLYITPYVLELVGPLLLMCAGIGFVLVWKRQGRGLVKGKELLMIWSVVPFILTYAYLFGVQWHGLRWIHFIPQPLSIWTGIGLAFLREKRLILVGFALIFTLQLILTLQGYSVDILNNIPH